MKENRQPYKQKKGCRDKNRQTRKERKKSSNKGIIINISGQHNAQTCYTKTIRKLFSKLFDKVMCQWPNFCEEAKM